MTAIGPGGLSTSRWRLGLPGATGTVVPGLAAFPAR